MNLMIGPVILQIFKAFFWLKHNLFKSAFLLANTESFEKETFSSQNYFGMTPVYWVILLIGGCIALTLTYVSWKKYHAEAKKKGKKDTTVD